MKIYIAGKITNNANYKEQFKRKELELKLQGHTVLTPTCLPLGFEWGEYMHICKAMIDVCDAVFFLKSWKDSKGAREEYKYTRQQGKELMFEELDIDKLDILEVE